MSRPYELKRRAQSQDRTRQRIVEAAIELHQTVGPARTTISDIADRAGVGRVTVYRHFPDEAALLDACSGRYYEDHPLPDPSEWRKIADPRARLRSGLAQIYAYHRATESMHRRVLADMPDDPVMAPYREHWDRAVDVLAAAWGARGRRRRMLRAQIALAVSFETWRTLVCEQGLDDDEALEIAIGVAST